MYSGVRPLSSAWFTLAFAASSFLTISAVAWSQAMYRGVSPSLLAWFLSAFASSSFVDLGVALLARTAASVVGLVLVGVRIEQRRDYLGVAFLAGDVQRRVAIVVGLIHVGVRSEQLRDDLGVAFLAGDVQRRPAMVVGLVHLGLRVEQDRDDLGVVVKRGDPQRRTATLFGQVHVGARIDQRRDDRRVAVYAGGHQRREVTTAQLRQLVHVPARERLRHIGCSAVLRDDQRRVAGCRRRPARQRRHRRATISAVAVLSPASVGLWRLGNLEFRPAPPHKISSRLSPRDPPIGRLVVTRDHDRDGCMKSKRTPSASYAASPRLMSCATRKRSSPNARAGAGKYLCVWRLHGFAASRTRNAAVPSAARSSCASEIGVGPPGPAAARRRSSAARSGVRTSRWWGGVHAPMSSPSCSAVVTPLAKGKVRLAP